MDKEEVRDVDLVLEVPGRYRLTVLIHERKVFDLMEAGHVVGRGVKPFRCQVGGAIVGQVGGYLLVVPASRQHILVEAV